MFLSAKSYLISAVNSAEDVSARLPDVLSCFVENLRGCARWEGKKRLWGTKTEGGNRWDWLMLGGGVFSFIRIKLLD